MEYKLKVSKKMVEKCKKFAEKSSSTQRPYRSGGTQRRDEKTIYWDTFRGKIAEAVVKEFLSQDPFNHEIELDFNVYERGKWDRNDFEIGGKDFQVKGVKHFSRWLLLETEDIDRGDVYDYYILTSVDEDMKGGKILGYAEHKEIVDDDNTKILKKEECIPGTETLLDASNYGRHKNHLHNSHEEWEELILPLVKLES